MDLMKPLKTFMSLGAVLALVSCQSKTAPGQQAQIPEVSVVKVVSGEGVSKSTYSTAIEGTRNIEIRPQTSGYLSKIYVDEGAYVKAGQILFKIDDRPFQEQYRTAKAAVLVAQANLKNVKLDLDRKIELVDNHIVSDLQVTQAQASHEAATAGLEQAKAAMNAAKINLDFSEVKAPVSGYIGRIPYRLGSLVSAASVEPMTLLTDIDQVYGYFSMSERDFSAYQDLRKGVSSRDSVTLVLASGKPYARKGVIDAVTGQFDKNTGSISIRTKFENPERSLRAGNTGRIEIVRKLDNVLIVPIKATFPVQDKIYAYTLDKDNKAKQVQIEVLGKTNTDYYVGAGIKEGQSVITGGLGFVKPDMVVKPKQ